MMYRALILEDDSNPSRVIDEVITKRWDDIPKAIIDKGHKTRCFVVYECQPTKDNLNNWVELGSYKLQD